jgi:hypothetical protein
MMLDGEVGSTAWADVAMAVMLGLRLPDVVFGRKRKLLRRHRYRRRDVGLRARHRTGRRSLFLIEIQRSSKLLSVLGCGASWRASRKVVPAANRMIGKTAAAAARIFVLVISTPTQPTGRYSAANNVEPVPVDSTTPKGVATSPRQRASPAPEWRLADAVL